MSPRGREILDNCVHYVVKMGGRLISVAEVYVDNALRNAPQPSGNAGNGGAGNWHDNGNGHGYGAGNNANRGQENN